MPRCLKEIQRGSACFIPTTMSRVATAWRHCLATGDHFNVEFRFRRASGAYVWARTAARPAHDSEGHITGWFGIALDLRRLQENNGGATPMGDGTVPSRGHGPEFTSGGWIRAARRPSSTNVWSISLAPLSADLDRPGMSRLEALAEFVHPDDAATFTQALRASIASGARFAVRYRQRRSDGVYAGWRAARSRCAIRMAKSLQWYGLCHDIDEQLQAEEALRNRSDNWNR